MKTVGCWLLNSKTTVERSTMTNRSLSFPLLLILLLLPVSHAKNDAETCEITAGPKNSAFVFVKREYFLQIIVFQSLLFLCNVNV
jgi:hypothetical protein